MTGFISTNLFLALLWWGKWKKCILTEPRKQFISPSFIGGVTGPTTGELKIRTNSVSPVMSDETQLSWRTKSVQHLWTPNLCHPYPSQLILPSMVTTGCRPLHPAGGATPTSTRGGVRRSQTLQQPLFGELDPLQRRGILCRRSYALLSRNLPGWGHETRTPSSPVSLHREQQHWLLRVNRISSHLNYPSCLLSLL